MARKSVIDNCRICGNRQKMAFGHVPPQSAFNDCPAVYKEGIELINTDPTRYFERGGGLSRSAAWELIHSANNAITIQAHGMELLLPSGRIKEWKSLGAYKAEHHFTTHFASILCG